MFFWLFDIPIRITRWLGMTKYNAVWISHYYLPFAVFLFLSKFMLITGFNYLIGSTNLHCSNSI